MHKMVTREGSRVQKFKHKVVESTRELVFVISVHVNEQNMIFSKFRVN